MRAPLRARFKDLPTSNMKEILLQRMLEENYDKGHANHRVAYEALQDSIRRDEVEDFDVDKAQEETKKKSSSFSPKYLPGSSSTSSSSSTHQGDQSTSTAAPSSSKTAASAEYSAWTTTDTRVKPSSTTIPDDLYMDDETTADEQAVSSDDEVGRDHIPTVNLRQSWWKPLTEDRPATPEPAWTIPSSDLSMPTNNWASALKSTYAPPQENSLLAQTGDMATFMDWYCKQQGISELTPKDLEGPAFEIVKVFHHDVIHLQFQMEECHKLLTDQVDDAILRYNISKPLLLGGEPGHVTIQPDFFFNKDLEYLRYGRKVGRPALSISKMKAAYYPDVGLEQLVPDQFWIEEECKYDIAAMYGISHWWFQRQRFYIDRFSSERDRRAVRTHMCILSVVQIEVFSMYGYNYMKKIVLRRADLKEYVIAERDLNHITHNEDGNPSRANIKQALCGEIPPLRRSFALVTKDKPACAIPYESTCSREQASMEILMVTLQMILYLILEIPVKEILLMMILPDHSRSSRGNPEDQAKMEMETPRSSGVNSPPNAHA
ncbi:hypothetical protein Tco_0786119 [Tanacetum coccineum]